MPTDPKILARAKELMETKPGPLMSPDLCAALRDCQVLAAALIEAEKDTGRLDKIEAWLQDNLYLSELVLMSDEEDGVRFSRFGRSECGGMHGAEPLEYSIPAPQTVRQAIDAAFPDVDRSASGGARE